MTVDRSGKQASFLPYVFAVSFFLAIQISAEHCMGRIWTCACGVIKLWEGRVDSEGNSQQFFDWYTPSHIEHGFIFFGLGWLFLRRFPVWVWLTSALAFESFWEILENSPIIIDRYRSVTVSYNYYGDSILNSGMDTVSMMAGFFLASRLPWKVTLGLAIFAELATLAIIRDNLTLNVLMLAYPIEAIRVWQGQ